MLNAEWKFSIRESVSKEILDTFDEIDDKYCTDFCTIILKLIAEIDFAIENPERKLMKYPSKAYPNYCLHGASLPMTQSYQTSERIIFHMKWDNGKLEIIKVEIEDLPWFKKRAFP